MDVSNDPRYPNTGDLIGCADGDVGLVLQTYLGGYENRLMVEVAWNVAGKTLTDPWNSEDFETADDMFHIMSRA